MKNKILIFGSLAVVVVIFIAGSIIFKNKKEEEQAQTTVAAEKLVKPDSPFMGLESSKVVMVEFLDPECEACAAYYPMIKGLVTDYKDRIKFVKRYMLLHAHSKEAAAAVEAAALQGKRWEMLAQLFFRKEWTHQETLRLDIFEDIAKNLALDIKKFKEDMNNPDIQKRIRADHEEGKSIGVPGTPTIFINGKQIIDISYESLKARLDRELDR